MANPVEPVNCQDERAAPTFAGRQAKGDSKRRRRPALLFKGRGISVNEIKDYQKYIQHKNNDFVKL